MLSDPDAPTIRPDEFRPDVAVVGGGPGGLRAAEVAASRGASVVVFDAKASVGRKFLVAGRGGLNLTKSESPDQFLAHYRGPDPAHWKALLEDFDPTALREWAGGLGVETFVASTGRVYPREMKAAPLLRRWVHRLRTAGVRFALHHRWVGLRQDDGWVLDFETPTGPVSVGARSVVLALGGGSWSMTGSDGRWVADLIRCGVAVAPLEPANCGWETRWPHAFLAEAEGLPLKNLTVTAGNEQARGELIITRYGLEGGPIYQLGAALRTMDQPTVTLDLKPGVSETDLVRKLGLIRKNFAREARTRWRLSNAAAALLDHFAPASARDSAEALARWIKAVRIELACPRPIDEAISSAGGVCWSGLDAQLMLRACPGVFCAGEMIDWEAPTGGYLMQGCFATGARAGLAASDWATRRSAHDS